MSSVEFLENNIMYIVTAEQASADFINKFKLEIFISELTTYFDKEFEIIFICREEFEKKNDAFYNKAISDSSLDISEDISKLIDMPIDFE